MLHAECARGKMSLPEVNALPDGNGFRELRAQTLPREDAGQPPSAIACKSPALHSSLRRVTPLRSTPVHRSRVELSGEPCQAAGHRCQAHEAGDLTWQARVGIVGAFVRLLRGSRRQGGSGGSWSGDQI